MVKAIDVANFFIDLANNVSFIDSCMTNLRINKMLYFAQVHSLARLGRPLFSEDFLAWDHGPVINDIFQKFKPYGGNRITAVSGEYSPDVFSDEEIALLLDVEREYRSYSAWGLVAITHKEGPWKNTLHNNTISMESLKDYASHLSPLPEFKLTYSSADVIGFHDAEGHLVLPKEEDDDDDDYEDDYE